MTATRSDSSDQYELGSRITVDGKEAHKTSGDTLSALCFETIAD